MKNWVKLALVCRAVKPSIKWTCCLNFKVSLSTEQRKNISCTCVHTQTHTTPCVFGPPVCVYTRLSSFPRAAEFLETTFKYTDTHTASSAGCGHGNTRRPRRAAVFAYGPAVATGRGRRRGRRRRRRRRRMMRGAQKVNPTPSRPPSPFPASRYELDEGDET